MRSPKRTSSTGRAVPQRPGLVLERLEQRLAERAPQRHSGGDHLGLLEHTVLEPLGPLLGLGVVQQVVGQLAQQAVQCLPGVVVRIAPDVGHPAHRLEVQPVGDDLVEALGGPPRRPLTQDVGEGLLVGDQPAVRLLQGQVDQAVVGVVGDDLLEQAACDRCDRLGLEPRDQHLLHERGDVCVAQATQTEREHGRCLGDDPVGVGGDAHPGAHPARDVGGRQSLPDHLLVQEVLGEELLQALAELVLAARDQRGVRDRQPERVPEQRRHREPVRHRPDHARLGAGVDEAEEADLVTGEDVDHRGEGQQTERDGLHPPQAGAPEPVGLGVFGEQRSRHDIQNLSGSSAPMLRQCPSSAP